MKTTRLQHGTLTHHPSADMYALRTATAWALPQGLMSIQAAIDYVTNVDLDGHGIWGVVGGRDKEIILQRRIHLIETQGVELRGNGEPEYGFNTKEGFTRLAGLDFQGVTDKTAYALRIALNVLNAQGWALDSVIDPWKEPPARFQVWRPQQKVTR